MGDRPGLFWWWPAAVAIAYLAGGARLRQAKGHATAELGGSQSRPDVGAGHAAGHLHTGAVLLTSTSLRLVALCLEKPLSCAETGMFWTASQQQRGCHPMAHKIAHIFTSATATLLVQQLATRSAALMAGWR